MIAFLSVFPPFRGGISRFSDHVLERLKLYDVVKAINYTQQYPSLLFPGKTQIDHQFISHESVRLVHAYNPLNWFTKKEYLSNVKIDHFIFTHWHPFFIPSTLRLISQLKSTNPDINISGIIHNVLPHESVPFQYELVEMLFKKSNSLITLSTEGTQSVNLFKKHAEKVKQLFHPIYENQELSLDKVETRKKWDLPDNACVVLFFGLIREYKGLSLLIEAFNKAADARDDIYLLIAGEFYESQTIYEEQIRPEFYSRVRIHNRFLSETEVAEILTLSDVLALPYKKATQSGVLADAMAYGLPAIATNQPGFTDFLVNKYNGIVLKTQSVEELASELVKIDKEKLKEMRLNMIQLRDKYSWVEFGKQLFTILEQI